MNTKPLKSLPDCTVTFHLKDNTAVSGYIDEIGQTEIQLTIWNKPTYKAHIPTGHIIYYVVHTDDPRPT